MSEHNLDEQTGLELLQTIRNETPSLPVVLCTASGSESVASEAIAAGVTDYIAVSDPIDKRIDDILGRLARAMRTSRRTNTQQERARQFGAIFHDTQTTT